MFYCHIPHENAKRYLSESFMQTEHQSVAEVAMHKNFSVYKSNKKYIYSKERCIVLDNPKFPIFDPALKTINISFSEYRTVESEKERIFSCPDFHLSISKSPEIRFRVGYAFLNNKPSGIFVLYKDTLAKAVIKEVFKDYKLICVEKDGHSSEEMIALIELRAIA